MPGKVLLNGRMIEPGLETDRAFHFGDGLFETIAVVNATPCLWHYHLQRLQRGCEALGLPMPEPDLLLAEAEQLIAGTTRATLKLLLTAGRAGQGYARPPSLQPTRLMRLSPWPELPHYQDRRPLQVQWCELRLANQPLLAGHKHLNRLEQVLARRELSSQMQEGLLCDQQGRVIEGIASNLFVQLDGRYITPPLTEAGVAGVVRQLILDRAADLGISVFIEPLSPQQVEQADALYLSSSLLGIRQIAELAGRRYDPATGPDPLLDLNPACFTFDGHT